MRSTTRAFLALIALLALAATLAACGGGDDTTDGTGAQSENTEEPAKQAPGEAATTAEPIQRDPANAGKKITIGSKNFPEQYILGEIYAQALRQAGFDVSKELDLGSEQVAFKALKSGRIDAYPEYTGTALTSFYDVKVDEVPRDKQESFELLQQKLQGDNVTALPQTPFENTYKITSTAQTAQELGNPKTISELAEKAGSRMSLSAFPECRQRTDCYVGLKRVYGWTPKFVSSQGQYEDLDQGQADFTTGFSTDGPLSLDKYVTYEDDKKLFPPYFVTLLTRDSANEKLGQSGRDIVQRVQQPLTEEVMQELNSRVTLDKQKPERVARDYLREAGFIS